MSQKTIGVIGYGNMGSAIAQQLKTDYQVLVFDQDKNKTVEARGVKVAPDIQNLVVGAEVIILAVKPQDFDQVLEEMQGLAGGKLIISIAAGISTGHIEKALGEIRVIRAMPNIGVKIGKAMTCLSKGRFATDTDFHFAQGLFDCLGKTIKIDEKMMNAATAISGSGPGYFFYAVESREEEYRKNPEKFSHSFIVSLTAAAETIGFNTHDAKFLAHWTAVYSELLLKKSKLSPKLLKIQVMSKGGTTEAALLVLYRGGSLEGAVKAALRRAQDLYRRD